MPGFTLPIVIPGEAGESTSAKTSTATLGPYGDAGSEHGDDPAD